MKGPLAARLSTSGSRRKCVIRWAPWMLLLLVLFYFQADLMAQYKESSADGHFSHFIEVFGGSWERQTPSLRTSWDPFDGTSNENTSNENTSNEHSVREPSSCEAWLEQQKRAAYSRNFSVQPILVGHGETSKWETCAIGCVFQTNVALEGANKADAIFGLSNEPGIESIVRSMESAQYYPENNIENAHGKGFTVVMTTSLSSEVPVGYFSWAEYELMAAPKKKTKIALAAAFISNCGGHNFRLEAIMKLRDFGISIDSYGACLRNQDGRVGKLDALRNYKFSLAFENSNEEDYVTEKFWQSLVAGSVPVVIGAPNIYDFAPSQNSILYIPSVSDIERVANQMKHLATHEDAYNATLSWKYEGPSDSFKALVDMAVVHSSCRLCLHIGTKKRLEEERQQKRECRCKLDGVTTYHLSVRERGKFEMESIFMRSSNLTLAALHEAIMYKFTSLHYVPIFKSGRPKSIHGDDSLKIYKVYPVGMTQRQALYTWKFENDGEFQSYVEKNPCANFEVIFV